MSIPEMRVLFKQFDFGVKGYLSFSELQALHYSIHCQSIDIKHVYEVVKHVTGSKDQTLIKLHVLPQLLNQLNSRRIMDDDLRWTFLSMADINRCLCLSSVFTLFEAALEDDFTPSLWRSFVKSLSPQRPHCAAFDDVKMWLINDPPSPTAEDLEELKYNWIQEEQKKLIKMEHERNSSQNILGIHEDETSRIIREEQERQNYADEVQAAVELTLKQQQHQNPSKREITLMHVQSLLEEKYKILRDLVIYKMLHEFHGVAWLSLPYLDRTKKVKAVNLQLRQLTRLNDASSNPPSHQNTELEAVADRLNLIVGDWRSAVGGEASLDLEVLMGSCVEIENEVVARLEKLEKLVEDPRSVHEMNEALKDALMPDFPGQSTFDQLLSNLGAREVAETSYLSTNQNQHDINITYCRLWSQLWYLRVRRWSLSNNFIENDVVFDEDGLQYSLASTGLAERSPYYIENDQYYSPDRERQEFVAEPLLLLSVTLKSVPTSCKKSVYDDGSPGIEMREVIDLALQKYEIERKAMGFFLNNPSVGEKLTSISRLDIPEIQQQLSLLFKIRSNWEIHDSTIKLKLVSFNHQTLEKAVCINRYLLRLQRIRPEDNIGVTLLADLQHVQDNKIAIEIKDIAMMSHAALVAKKFDLEKQLQLNSFDNIATIVFKDFEEISVHLRFSFIKYDLLRRQIFLEVCDFLRLPSREATENKIGLLIADEFALRAIKDWKAICELLQPLNKNFVDIWRLMGPCERLSEKGKDVSQPINALADVSMRQSVDELAIESACRGRCNFRQKLLANQIVVETVWEASHNRGAEFAALNSGLMERVLAYKDYDVSPTDLDRIIRIVNIILEDPSSPPVSQWMELVGINMDQSSLQFWHQMYVRHAHEQIFLATQFSSISSDLKHHTRSQLAQVLTDVEVAREQSLSEASPKIVDIEDQLLEAGEISFQLVVLNQPNDDIDHQSNLKLHMKNLVIQQIKEIAVYLNKITVNSSRTYLTEETDLQIRSRELGINKNLFTIFMKSALTDTDNLLDETNAELAQIEQDEIYTEALKDIIGEEEWNSMDTEEKKNLINQVDKLALGLAEVNCADKLDHCLNQILKSENSSGDLLEDAFSLILDNKLEENSQTNLVDQIKDYKLKEEKQKTDFNSQLRAIEDSVEQDNFKKAKLLRLRHENSKVLGNNNPSVSTMTVKDTKATHSKNNNKNSENRSLRTLKDSIDGLMMTVEAKHVTEKQEMISMLNDLINTESNKFVALSQTDLKEEIKDLQSLYMLSDSQEDKKEALTDLLEAQFTLYKHTNNGADGTKFTSHIMNQLEDLQNKELESYIQNGSSLNADDLIKLATDVSLDQDGTNYNPYRVVCTNDTDDAEVNKIERCVKKKYDVLEAAILRKSVVFEMGEDKWNKSSERDKERRIKQQKRRLHQLGREGRHEEVAGLLGGCDSNYTALSDLLDKGRKGQRALLEERLDALKAQGLPEEKVEAERAKGEKQIRFNILSTLKYCCDQDKNELLRRLAAIKEAEAAEKERQLAITRLNRETRLMLRETRDLTALMLISSCDKQEKQFTSEKERQRELAAQRLLRARSLKKGGASELSDPSDLLVIGDEPLGVEAMKERIIMNKELVHVRDRNLLVELMENSGSLNHLIKKSTDNLNIELEICRQNYNVTDQYAVDQRHKLLCQATCLRLALLLQSNPSKEEAMTTLLTDLQILQDKKEEEQLQWLSGINNKDTEHLQQIMSQFEHLSHVEPHLSLVSLLFDTNHETSPPISGQFGDVVDETNFDLVNMEKEIVDLLETNFCLLKEKTIEAFGCEALGEKQWNSLNDEQRKKKVTEMSIALEKILETSEDPENSNESDQQKYDKKLIKSLKSVKAKLVDEKKRFLGKLSSATSANQRKEIRQKMLMQLKKDKANLRMESGSLLLSSEQNIDYENNELPREKLKEIAKMRLSDAKKRRKFKQIAVVEESDEVINTRVDKVLDELKATGSTDNMGTNVCTEMERGHRWARKVIIDCLESWLDKPKKIEQLLSKDITKLKSSLISLHTKWSKLPWSGKDIPSRLKIAQLSLKERNKWSEKAARVRKSRENLLIEALGYTGAIVIIKRSSPKPNDLIMAIEDTAIMFIIKLEQLQFQQSRELESELMNDQLTGDDMQDIYMEWFTRASEGYMTILPGVVFHDYSNEQRRGSIIDIVVHDSTPISPRRPSIDQMNTILQQKQSYIEKHAFLKEEQLNRMQRRRSSITDRRASVHTVLATGSRNSSILNQLNEATKAKQAQDVKMKLKQMRQKDSS